MVDSDRGWSIAHHVNKGSSFLLLLSIRLSHRVAFHLVFLERTLTAVDDVLLYVGKTSVQTLSCIVLEIIVCHYRVSELKI